MIICDLCGVKLDPKEVMEIEPVMPEHYCERCSSKHSAICEEALEWRSKVRHRLDNLFKNRVNKGLKKLKEEMFDDKPNSSPTVPDNTGK